MNKLNKNLRVCRCTFMLLLFHVDPFLLIYPCFLYICFPFYLQFSIPSTEVKFQILCFTTIMDIVW